MTMSEEKKVLRRRMIALRDSLSEPERTLLNEKIRRRFLERFHKDLFETPGRECLILLYASVRSEADTMLLWNSLKKEADRSGSKVLFAFPKVEGERKMSFYPVNSEEDLKPAFRGIPEPVGTERISADRMRECYTVLVMPGVAFDEEGNRMGYGGGFYDTYLEENGAFIDVKAALAYEIQITGEPLLTEAHDQKPDLIVTEKRLLTPYAKYDKID